MTLAKKNTEQLKSDLSYLRSQFLLSTAIPFLLFFLNQIELPNFEIRLLIILFFSFTYFYLLFFLIISIQTFSRSTSVVSACKDSRNIQFINYFTKRRTQIDFNKLDGYITGRMRNYIGMHPSSKNKVIWIVKGGKMIERIDEYYVFNFNELEEELKELPYLGYQIFRLSKRFKMLFGPISID